MLDTAPGSEIDEINENVSPRMCKIHIFRFISRIRKVSHGHLLSIDAFYYIVCNDSVMQNLHNIPQQPRVPET